MPLKLRALESLWSRFHGDKGFDAYVAREGILLERYACFCVLAERHAGSWGAVAPCISAFPAAGRSES